MRNVYLFPLLILIALTACRQGASSQAEVTARSEAPRAAAATALDAYVQAPDEAFDFEVVEEFQHQTHRTYVIRMISQRWLTEAEVEDPTWWHWLTMVVPNELSTDKGLLFIGGGSRNREAPTEADGTILQLALQTQSVVTSLHNVPNQPMVFKGDDFGARKEDELIAYGWRQFLEGGGKEEDAIWLARLPMTKAAVRAMDVVTAITRDVAPQPVEQFVVAGASKRGWTTWTTAAVDDRVIGIAPMVIDMLNVVPSFQHHWRVYGFWAPAVGNYVAEGIMEWQDSQEYQRLISLTEPFSYRQRLDMPKLIINATGDQFFLPDSWRFYWGQLPGETHLRYIPNTDHSLRNPQTLQNLMAFYAAILQDEPRPTYAWNVEGGRLLMEVDPERAPRSVQLWQAHNPDSRDLRLETIGEAWHSQELSPTVDGHYEFPLTPPDSGYTAFLGTLTYDGPGGLPLTFSTGVVISPDTYPHAPYSPDAPKGTHP